MAHKLIVGALLAFVLNATLARGEEPTDALTIRMVQPDRQLERLIGLFDGARVPHPAAAMAAWKRTGRTLGKPMEAALAALNPEMVRELRNLDDARIGFGFDPDDGRPRWFLVAPHDDDGVFTALTVALALTDGGADSRYLRVEVDRLGRAGSPLALKIPGRLVLASSRADLPSAFDAARGRDGASTTPSDRSGWVFRLDPALLPTTGSLASRRVVEALHAAGLRGLDGRIGLEGETLEAVVTGRFPEAGAPALDPSWLDWTPSSGVAAVGSLALDPSPQAWDARFAWADRVEHADPANGPLAPLRTRLTLASIAAGIQPEADLFPQLRGVTAFVLAAGDDEPAPVVGAFAVAIHMASPDAADRLATHLVPRATASILKRTGPEEASDDVQRLGQVAGRPLEVARRGATVLIGWGAGAVQAGLAAHRDPERSAGARLRALWDADSPPQRLGLVWPGRLQAPLLADAPPVVWIGRDAAGADGQGTTTHDVLRWGELRGVVRRFLERLPLDPVFTP